MTDGDEADEEAEGTPEEIGRADTDLDAMFVVDGGVDGEHGERIIEERAKRDVVAIDARAAALADGRWDRGKVGDGVETDAADDMDALVEQRKEDFSRGVEGVDDEVEGDRDSEFKEEGDHFVEEGAIVPVGEDEAFVDTGSQRDTNDAFEALSEDADGLTGMAHDPGGLGVGSGRLMELLDGWHLLA